MNDIESRMWRRYVAKDLLQGYHRQLVMKKDSLVDYLGSGELSEEDVERIGGALEECKSLQSIRLCDFSCSAAVWRKLMTSISKLRADAENTPPSLSNDDWEFKLTCRKVIVWSEEQDEEQDEDGGCSMMRGLAEHLLPNRLSKLHLQGCNLSPQAVQRLLSWPTNTTIDSCLKLLSLEGNEYIGSAGFCSLAPSLPRLSALETFSIERTGSPDSGMMALLDSVQHQPRLKCLNLMANHMSRPVVERLSRLVSHENFVLEQVLWTGGNADEKRTIDFWLRVNRAGRRFIFSNGDKHLPRKLWSRVLERVSRTTTKESSSDVIFYFLRSRPDMVDHLSGY